MIKKKKNHHALLILLFLSLCMTACAPYIGTPSMTFLSNSISQNSDKYEWIGNVEEESETFIWAFIFLANGNPQPSHESLVSRLLEKNNADVLLDSELSLSTYGVPYIFLMHSANVKGKPARFKKGDI